MTQVPPENGPEPRGSKQDEIARAEYVACAATLIPESILLVGSEPELVDALRAAHRVAMEAVARLEATPIPKEAGLPTLTTL